MVVVYLDLATELSGQFQVLIYTTHTWFTNCVYSNAVRMLFIFQDFCEFFSYFSYIEVNKNKSHKSTNISLQR